MEVFLWIFFGIGAFVTGLLVLKFLFYFIAHFVTKIITLFPRTKKKVILENARNSATHRQDVALYDESRSCQA